MDKWLKCGTLKRHRSEVKEDGGDIIPVKVQSVSDEHNLSKNSVSAKVRKYNSDYLSLGFTYSGTENEPKPQCVICFEILSNEAMKPAKLRRHLETKHPDCKSKPAEFFKIKLGELKNSKKLMSVSAGISSSENATIASYEVSQLVAKSGKAHTIAEELILPAAVILCKRMLGDSAAKIMSTVPLSNNTVQRRISDMASNIEDNLFSKLSKCNMFALQVDESTDISKKAIMLVFVRFIFEKQLHEDFLMLCELLHTTAEAIFNELDNFFKKHNIAWSKCVGLSTDGAKAMSGQQTGLHARIKVVAPNVKWTHCFIHREALVVKRLPETMQKTFNEVVKVVNYIKTRPLQSRLFSLLCKEMGSEHDQLLLHTEVRWLSRGRVLNRFFELRDEVLVFLSGSQYEGFLTDFLQLCTVAYLADIFDHMNILNQSLQGNNVDMFQVHDKVSAMIKKCQIWATRIEKGSTTNFPTLQQFIESADVSLPQQFIVEIAEHLRGLSATFGEYFPELDSNYDWVRNPFTCRDIERISTLTDKEQDELVDLTSNGTMKNVFDDTKLIEFWLMAHEYHHDLSSKALKTLLPFVTTYRCEQAFSTMCFMKNKYRNRLDMQYDFRVKVSSIQPNISELIKSKKRFNLSH